MVEFIFILLSFFIFNCNGYSIYSEDYNFDSNIWHNFSYSTLLYDYYVLVGQVHDYTTINIDFIPTTHNMNVYYLFSKIYFSDVKDYISNFYEMFRNINPGTHASISYEIPQDYPYIYIAFWTEGEGWVDFQFKTNLTYSSTDDTTDDTTVDTTDDTTDDTTNDTTTIDTTDDATNDTTVDTTDDTTIIAENKKKFGINKLLLAFIITVSVLVIIIIILIVIIVFKNKNNDLMNKVNQVSFSDDNKTNEEENLIMDKND